MGVTILAVLEILGGLLALLGGLGIMAVAGIAGASYSGVFGALGSLLGIIFIIVALISFAIAWGFLGGKSWARTLGIIFAAIEALYGLLGLIGGNWSSLITIIIGALIVYYLMRPDVIEYFKPVQATTPQVSTPPA